MGTRYVISSFTHMLVALVMSRQDVNNIRIVTTAFVAIHMRILSFHLRSMAWVVHAVNRETNYKIACNIITS